MTNEKKQQLQQAVNVIKQTLDKAFKIGVASNLEEAGVITQSFQIIIQTLQNGAKPDNNDSSDN